MQDNKIILVDFSIFMFRSIYCWRNNKQIPPTYTAINMILSNLKKIGCDPDDEIIFAIDSQKNWRKIIDESYKGNRKDIRESQPDIPWDKMWKDFDNLLEDLKETSPFKIIKTQVFLNNNTFIKIGKDILYYNPEKKKFIKDKIINNNIDIYGSEADDIIAYSCRYFAPKKCIILSYDEDYSQLCCFDNVKIFSPIKKLGAKKGSYKIIKDPWKVLAKKIKKEASDNLVSPILTEMDFDKRKMIVDLTSLPDFVEKPIKEALDNLEEKDYDLTRFPFENLRNRFMSIYNSNKDIVTYKKCIAFEEKKKLKKNKKKKNG